MEVELKVGDIINYNYGIDSDNLLILKIEQEEITVMNLWNGKLDKLKSIWIGTESVTIIG